MNKQRIICIILVFLLLVGLISYAAKQAYAIGDPLTLAQISSLSYAIGSSFGLNFNMSDLTPANVQTYFSNKINSWMAGRSIAEVFGSDQARIIAGKLVVPHLLFNGIKDFLSSFVVDNEITDTEKQITYFDANYSYTCVPYLDDGQGRKAAAWIVTNLATGNQEIKKSGFYSQYQPITNKGIEVVDVYVNGLWITPGNPLSSIRLGTISTTNQSSIGAALNGEIPETVLNPDEEWSGLIGGQDWPDTNLDQLIGYINQSVADNNLEVEGEVEPVTPPTPVPTIEPGDIDAYWNRQSDQMEGLGNDIGDISGKLDDLGQQAGDITDAIEGVNQGIQSQTGVISGALDQAAQDVADAIGEQTQVLDESLTATAEGVQDIADALTAPEIDEKTFDLRELFPFCIPFDIYHLLQKFDGTPTAPHVQLPIVIPSIGFSYTMDLDFSAWDPVAAAMRTVELIVYALGLAWATSKVIKW